MSSISVTEPISQAFDRTHRTLFKPFDLPKWFALGFCAWLAQLGEGGGNINLPGGGGGGGGGPAPAPPLPGPGGGGAGGGVGAGPAPPAPTSEFDLFLQQARNFLLNNLSWIVPVLCVLLILGVVIMWVRARGKFMFLHDVANDRSDIVEPWKRSRPQANSYFRFELVLTLLMLLGLAGVGGALFVVALPDIRAQRWGGAGITAIVAGTLFVIGWSIAYAVVKAVADDFLIPLMYLRTSAIGPAWREFRAVVLPGHVWVIVLYLLMRWLLGMAEALIMLVGFCVTCCIAVLPYLGTVLFLPIFVFNRNYSLYFLRQFAPDYDLVVERVPLPAFPVILPPPPLGAQPSQSPVPPPPPQVPPPHPRRL